MELKFVPAAPEDTDPIFHFARELILRYEDPAEIDLETALQWTRRKIASQIHSYTRVLAGEETAGYYRFSPQGREMELDDVYILPPFRHLGIGTAIVRKCCAETDRPIFLYCFRENTGALALYQGLGFEISELIGSTRAILRREVL